MKKEAILFLQLCVVLTGTCGLIYLALQQDIRQEGNNPQIQMAQDAETEMANGVSPQTIVGASVDIAHSLRPYMMLFNAQGNLIASSALFHDKIPTLPNGILQYTKANGLDKVTWQPEPGVRQALVIEYNNGKNPGYIVAGRSLRETEEREDNALGITFVGYIAILLGITLLEFFKIYQMRKDAGDTPPRTAMI